MENTHQIKNYIHNKYNIKANSLEIEFIRNRVIQIKFELQEGNKERVMEELRKYTLSLLQDILLEPVKINFPPAMTLPFTLGCGHCTLQSSIKVNGVDESYNYYMVNQDEGAFQIQQPDLGLLQNIFLKYCQKKKLLTAIEID